MNAIDEVIIMLLEDITMYVKLINYTHSEYFYFIIINLIRKYSWE